ncbi:MAG: ribosome maturation factor RimP [Hyphomicrobiaceae bacterium]|nr:ribosome maturation factor RimP [Hyphomicrobiaceae bacterium]
MTGESGASRERFIRETGLAAQASAVIEPVIQDLGYRLVRLSIQGRDGIVLQIMAERPDGSMTIEDCETISRQVSPLLDVNDMFPGSYRLEVSSPGIDRPLVRPSDFEDWAGYEAKIELAEMIDGRKRFRGMLEGFENGEALIEVDLQDLGPTVIGLPVGLIAEARLVLSDELIREALARAKKSKQNRPEGADDAPGDGDEMDVED